MSGIFDAINHPGTGENDVTLPPSFIDGLLLMKISGIRTNQQLLAIFEGALQRSATNDEISDLLDIVGYIEAGANEAQMVARLHRFTAVCGIWETGQGNLTEAEGRTITGVTFS